MTVGRFSGGASRVIVQIPSATQSNEPRTLSRDAFCHSAINPKAVTREVSRISSAGQLSSQSKQTTHPHLHEPPPRPTNSISLAVSTIPSCLLSVTI